jgi:nucleotide-binding universal stress UspA family protein
MSPSPHVLVATDFGPASACALETACAMAVAMSGRLTVLHVLEPVAAGMRPSAPTELEAALASARRKVAAAQSVLRVGVPSDEILRAAAELEADFLVVGTHGRRGIARAWLGSVADSVVRRSTAPVVTVQARTTTEVARTATA